MSATQDHVIQVEDTESGKDQDAPAAGPESNLPGLVGFPEGFSENEQTLLTAISAGLSPSTTWLYLFLCQIAGETRFARYPGTTAMSRVLGVDDATVYRAQIELDKFKLVSFKLTEPDESVPAGKSPEKNWFEICRPTMSYQDRLEAYRDALLKSKRATKTRAPRRKQVTQPCANTGDISKVIKPPKRRPANAKSIPPLTGVEKGLVSTSPELMNRYLRFGVMGVREPNNHSLNSEPFDWYKSTNGPVDWTVQQFAGYFWACVCHSRAFYKLDLRLPDFGMLVKHMGELYRVHEPRKLMRMIQVLTSHFQALRAERSLYLETCKLDETSLRKSDLIMRVEEIAQWPDEQIAAWASQIQTLPINETQQYGQEESDNNEYDSETLAGQLVH